MINPVFDAVVIGCGMFGGCCAESSFETTGLQKSSLFSVRFLMHPEIKSYDSRELAPS